MASQSDWAPDSWRKLPIKQQPAYPDQDKLQAALNEVSRLPPLVTPQEVDSLREQLAEVASGKRFLLQGGDCAERFMDCSADPIEKKLKILLQMSLVLTWGARIPTLRIARMAGQFAKPRSKETEVINGVEMTAFRGDNVNSFDTSNRTPDPDRLVQGYFHSAATLNYARAVLASGLADLNAASHWDLGFVQDPMHRGQYKEMVDRILSSLDFMRVCGVADEAALKTASVFMSHEGLQLCFEEAMTRAGPPPAHVNAYTRANQHTMSTRKAAQQNQQYSASSIDSSGGGAFGTAAEPHTPVHPPAAHSTPSKPPQNQQQQHAHDGGAPASTPSRPAASNSSSGSVQPYYNLGSHFLWIGDRTRQIDHAHVEYFRGIQNPVGIKVGPSSDPVEIVQLIRRLWPNPRSQPGKVVLITRMGAANVKTKLPPVIKAIHDAGFTAPVVWQCDPMHGNTKVSGNGYKTREYNDILLEIKHTFEVHREMGSRLGGVHFELTGENVTECTGGPEKLCEADLPHRYTTYCDPRLNYAQGMELAFLIAQYLADERETYLAAETGISPEEFHNGGSEVFHLQLPAAASAASASSAAASSASEGGQAAASGLQADTSNGGIKRNTSKASFAAGRGLSPALKPLAADALGTPVTAGAPPPLGL